MKLLGLGLVLLIIVMGVAISGGGDPDSVKKQWQHSAPGVASLMTNDWSHNQCILDTAPRMRATHSDWERYAEMVCSIKP